MRGLVALVLLLLLAGCSTVTVKKDGFEIKYTRVWFETEGFSVDIDNVGAANVSRVSNNQEIIELLLPLMVRAAAGTSGNRSFTDLLKQRIDGK